MAGRVLINPATGLEDSERVTVAFLVGGAALERGETDDGSAMVSNASLACATPMLEWIGEEHAAIFSY